MKMTAPPDAPLPSVFVDAHHHFLDTGNNDFQQDFLGKLLPNTAYLPYEYQKQVTDSLNEVGVELAGSVHVECIPDDGLKEVLWVDSLTTSSVQAIVGSCDLTSETIDQDLTKLKEASPKLKGIRWILDCVGPYAPNTATHIATKRHDGIDYLRGSDGGYDGSTVPEFERGYACLAKHNLSFDLQCAPIQLPAAAALFAKYPDIPVCIDHLGKPRTLLGPDEPSNTNIIPDEVELATWRAGMKAMAKLPQVYVKISMLGFALPGWVRTPERVALMKGLVREVVELFGPKRCMFALNWWNNGAMSDADGLSDVGPDAVDFLRYMASFVEDYSEEDRELMFANNAREFYKFWP